MADISTELAVIANAVHGKDMRTAIHDAIQKVNNNSGGGGGGGGGMSTTTLWSSNDGTTVGTTYDLSDDISNYDILWLKTGNPADISNFNKYEQASILVSLIYSSETVGIASYYKRGMEISFTGSTFQVTRSYAIDESSNVVPKVYAIVGVKF